MKNTLGMAPRKIAFGRLGKEKNLTGGLGSFQESIPDRLVNQALGNFEGYGRSHRRLFAAGRPTTRLVERLAGNGAMSKSVLGLGFDTPKDHMVTTIGPYSGLAKCQYHQPEDKSPNKGHVWHR
jgi:hypothetical protein